MVTVMAPPAISIRLYCSHLRMSRDGLVTCNHVLGIVEVKALDGQVIKIKCPKCQKETEFR